MPEVICVGTVLRKVTCWSGDWHDDEARLHEINSLRFDLIPSGRTTKSPSERTVAMAITHVKAYSVG
jgi:hypothetical protein